jgi:hypothetical protein
MNFLQKKLDRLVVLTVSTCLVPVLMMSHPQKVNAQTPAVIDSIRQANPGLNATSPKQIPVIDQVNQTVSIFDASGNLMKVIDANDSAAFSTLLFNPIVVNLDGVWQADDGGTYYLRQVNGQLFWYGENDRDQPSFSNTFRGVATNAPLVTTEYIVGGSITGGWADVPKGSTLGSGFLELRILSADRLERVSETGGFSGQVWTRVR